MLKKSIENESDKLQLGSIPSSWTGVDLFNWLKFEDKISPPIRRLLGYDTDFAKDLGMVWEGLETYEELMFLYINRDIWGLKPYA
jgi:hypothetical protein